MSGIALGLWLLAACTGPQISSKDNREKAGLHMDIGTGYLRQGNYPMATRELTVAEQLDPSNPYILNNLGLTYFVREEFALATEKFQAALKPKEDYSEARNNLARVYIQMEKYKDAIRELKIVVKDLLYPQPEKTWTNLGLAYLKREDYDEARNALLKAIRINRNYCPAYTLYGRALYEEENYSAAAESLDQAVSKCHDQSYDEPIYYGAVSYLKIGQTERARAKLQEILERFPKGLYAQKARSLLQTIR